MINMELELHVTMWVTRSMKVAVQSNRMFWNEI